MNYLQTSILLISTFYIIIGITNSKLFEYSLEYPFIDIFGKRKITRYLDKLFLYLSLFL